MNIRPICPLVTYFAALFVVLVLIGCGNALPPTGQTIIQATTGSEPTSTPTPTQSPNPTPTHSPTPTTQLAFTIIPASTETIDPTQAAFETYHAPTVEAEGTSMPLTQEAVSTLNAAFPDSCGYEYPSVSPNGNWLADDCNEFHVVSRDGQKKITITHKELAPPDSNVSSVVPINWSKDSQYLYFTTHFCCADTDARGWDGPLYRLDMQSSAWVKMTDGYFNYYSFSPTGRRLLHIPNDQGGGPPVELHILDLKSGAEQKINLNSFEQAGMVLWKPDGTSFVISAQVGNSYEENRQFALLLVALDDLSITNLISLGKREWLYATDWSKDDVLTISNCHYDGSHEICQTFPYDLKSLPSVKLQ